MKFPITPVHVIGTTLFLTGLVYWDSSKHKVDYKNAWVLGTAFFPPVAFAYGLLRYLSSHKVELTKRQQMEILKRQELQKHREEIRAERRAMEKAAKLKRAGKTQETIAKEQQADLARQAEEREKLRENLDYHAKRRADRLKLRKD